MKKLGDLMEELGFKNEASDATKAAFIKHLIDKAYKTNIKLPAQYQQILKLEKKAELEDFYERKKRQLSFDLDNIEQQEKKKGNVA